MVPSVFYILENCFIPKPKLMKTAKTDHNCQAKLKPNSDKPTLICGWIRAGVYLIRKQQLLPVYPALYTEEAL